MTTLEQQTPDPRAPKPDDMIHFAFHPSIPKPESVPWNTYEFALRDTSRRWRERYTLLKNENAKLRADIQTMNDRCTEITNDHIAATKRNVQDNQVLRVQNEALITERDRWRECAEKLAESIKCGRASIGSTARQDSALAEYTRCVEGAPEPGGWRDIATAPKDGEDIIVGWWSESFFFQKFVHWNEDQQQWLDDNGFAHDGEDSDLWHPLLPAPATSTK